MFKRKGEVTTRKENKTTPEQLSDGSLDIMLILWKNNKPMKAIDILNELNETRDWQKATLQVLLGRLAERGIVKITREKNYNLFSPLITEEEYRSSESKTFLQKICRGSFKTLVTTLVSNNSISEEDMKELIDIISRGGKQ